MHQKGWQLCTSACKINRLWQASIIVIIRFDIILLGWFIFLLSLSLQSLPCVQGQALRKWLFIVKTGGDSSTVKRLATGASVTGPRRWPLKTDDPCHSRCETLKNHHCSMTMNAEYRLSNLQPFTDNEWQNLKCHDYPQASKQKYQKYRYYLFPDIYFQIQ